MNTKFINYLSNYQIKTKPAYGFCFWWIFVPNGKGS